MDRARACDAERARGAFVNGYRVGTSLVEVVVAMAISVVVLTLLAQAWRGCLDVVAHSRESALRWRVLEESVELLADDEARSRHGKARRRWLVADLEAGEIERGYELATESVVHRWVRDESVGRWLWNREVTRDGEVSLQILIDGLDLGAGEVELDSELREECVVLDPLFRVRGAGVDWLRVLVLVDASMVEEVWLMPESDSKQAPLRLVVHEYLGGALAVDELPPRREEATVVLELRTTPASLRFGFDDQRATVRIAGS